MAKMSENSIKLLEFLKANAGKKMTADEISEKTNLPKATINGAFTSFQKKGLGVREKAMVKGTSTVKFLQVTDEGKVADVSELSEIAQGVIKHLIATNNAPATMYDVAEAIGVDARKVNGCFNSIVKKGLGARVEAKVEADVETTYLYLTDAGLAYQPEDDAE